MDYPKFADIADEEGFPAIAKMYREIAVAEKGHEERYLAFVKNIEDDKVFKKDVEVVWQCRNCGYIYVGTEAPETCPACLGKCISHEFPIFLFLMLDSTKHSLISWKYQNQQNLSAPCHRASHMFFRAINLSYMVCPRLMPDKYQYMP